MNLTLMLRASLLACLVLAGCGGSGGGSEPAPPPASTSDVPASATASPDAFVSWSNTQPPDDTKEPLKVEGTMPPTSETEEPVTIG